MRGPNDDSGRKSATNLDDRILQLDRTTLGRLGEAQAASYLRRRGYRIIERNVRYDGVEIDLVVKRGGLVAFVEVKTRRSESLGPPELAVDARKQARIVRAARAWLCENRGASARIRFDVVTCRPIQAGSEVHWRIEHLPAAFEAGG
jgi:putative endonuclease